MKLYQNMLLYSRIIVVLALRLSIKYVHYVVADWKNSMFIQQ